MKQVTVLKGEITEPGFGLSSRQLTSIEFDTLIHSAALTDHFGRQEIFDKINVHGTKNAIELAKAAGAALLHVSTSSVAGTYYTYDTGLKGEFTENSFYAGQNFADNEYVRSKFLAEEAVQDAIAGGLNARIMRVGLLTGTLDGHFQMRPEKNAFANRIKALCSVGCVPMGMLGERLEITPVDSCAQAILKLAVTESRRPVYHVFNDAISLGEVIALLEQNGFMFEVVSDSEFERRMKGLSKQGEISDLAGLIEDLNTLETSNIVITANITKQELASEGFSWPAIDAEYMGLFLNSIKKSPEKEI
jgi:fengycin family lipopeptide synthetase D